jgi:hypothetical protein
MTSKRRREQCYANDSVRIAGGPYGAEALVLQARPIGEPVAQYGPFVMNDDAGIQQAFADYRTTGFGGWPWPTDDPVHAREGRFAIHPDGRREIPGAALASPGTRNAATNADQATQDPVFGA